MARIQLCDAPTVRSGSLALKLGVVQTNTNTNGRHEVPFFDSDPLESSEVLVG